MQYDQGVEANLRLKVISEPNEDVIAKAFLKKML
jgi:hypothetical protein